MFERFTEAARQVVVQAQQSARQLDHGHIGTEHLLLGLLADAEQAPAQVLVSFGVSEQTARARVIELEGTGDQPPSAGQIPFSPRAKRALELSLRESLSLGHKSIRPGHLLLGLLRADGGLASRILLDFNVEPERLRGQVIERLEAEPDVEVAHARPERVGPRSHRQAAASGAVSEDANIRFVVQPDAEARRLLMAAAGRALSDARDEFGLDDLRAVLGTR